MRALGVVALALGIALPSTSTAQRIARDTLHPYRPGVDVRDYDITLDLPDTGAIIEARAVLTVERRTPVDTLVLDLLDLRVDSVLVDRRAVAFGRDSTTVRVPLPASGDLFTVAVRYGGRVTDGLIVRTDSVGRWTYFGDNWPDRARHWIPSIDHPSDKATVTWTVRAPSDHRVVANGELEEETPLGAGRTLTRWREARPIPVYLMVIAAAPLAYYDLKRAGCGFAERAGCVQQAVYVAPEVREFLPGPFAHAPDIVDFFSRLVAPFPYEKLAHLESATRFGGMENATAIFYADAPFRTRTMGPGVIAHETAHQWFGDAVTEREWGHLWLSEGFASYFEQLWWQHIEGDTSFRRRMGQLRDQVIASAVTAERPVLDTAETQYLRLLNTNSYQKGAWVLHMLRAQLGDSAFFRGIRAYYAAHAHATALTDDLRLALERAAGRPSGALRPFFDQWLRRPGVVDATLRWRYDAAAKQLTVEVEQSARFAPYAFPLTLDVGAGRRVTLQVAARPTQRLTAPLAAAPTNIIADPDVELLGRVTVR